MKIFLDIGHPAHVHYFKNFIKIMERKGHQFFIIAKNKEVTFSLLKYYNIPYKSRGKSPKNIVGKFFNIFAFDLKVLYWALKFKPDIFLSFAGGPSRIGKLLRIPAIAFDDTEHAKLSHELYLKNASIIFTPSCYLKTFKDKQLFFYGYMELCYLHPNYFIPDKTVLKELGINENNKYIVLRFVSWDASHDLGQKGIDILNKKRLISELSKYAKIFISSEAVMPAEFNPYKISVAPEKMHSVLHFATLYIGEGATMASECAMLGIPAIYVNSLNAGTLMEQEKYGLIYQFRDSKGVLEKTLELLETSNLKVEFQKRRQKMLSEKIDITAFMVWFIENYPKSTKIIKDNPDYQYKFK